MSLTLNIFYSVLLLIIQTNAEPTLFSVSSNVDSQLYYLTSQTGTAIPNSTIQKLPHVAATMFKGRAYFIGGLNSARVTSFDPVTGIYRNETSMQSIRGYHSVTALNDSIIACGGKNGTAITDQDTFVVTHIYKHIYYIYL
jgi:hypothetical protein